MSAGFVRFRDGVPECYGKSDSLSLGGADDDTEMVKRLMGFE